MNSLPEPHGWPGLIVCAVPLLAAVMMCTTIALRRLYASLRYRETRR
jgi:hypothetical protein